MLLSYIQTENISFILFYVMTLANSGNDCINTTSTAPSFGAFHINTAGCCGFWVHSFEIVTDVNIKYC